MVRLRGYEATKYEMQLLHFVLVSQKPIVPYNLASKTNFSLTIWWSTLLQSRFVSLTAPFL